MSDTGKPQDSVLGGQLVLEQGNNRITVYDPVNKIFRMIIGVLPDGTIGMVVSQPGYDVFSLFS